MQIYNLNYEELTKLYDAKDVPNSQKLDPISTMMVVRSNKSLWRDFLKQDETGKCPVKSKIYDLDIH